MEARLKEAYSYCGDLARRKAGNFYYAFRFLSPAKRRGIFALYAFCQYGDQLVDEPAPGEDSLDNLNRLSAQLDDCFKGNSDTPLFIALADSVQRFGLPRRYFRDLIEGMMTDLERRRYQTFEELVKYCYLVASTVGLLCIEIFGYREGSVKRYAEFLGIAMQLTNIIRDVSEDYRRGRIYLPLEEMERFEYSEAGFASGLYNVNFQKLMRFQYDRAMDYYRKAVSALPGFDRRNQAASEIMRVIYTELLETIRERRFQIFDGRISLESRRKASLALRTYINIMLGGRDRWQRLR